MQWVSLVTTIGMGMALPALLGSWLDRRWGTAPWCVTAGAALGFAVGLTHLLQLASGKQRPGTGRDRTNSAATPQTASQRQKNTTAETKDGTVQPENGNRHAS